MTLSTYGEHAENAARALNNLILNDLIPTEEIAVDQLMHYREAVVDALRQRLYDVGHDNTYPTPARTPAHTPARTPARTPKPTLAGLDEKLATLVDNIAFALPTLPAHEHCSPADYLAPASTDSTAETWRFAAIELLTASHALSAAAEQPWRTESGAGWWVMRDISVALEAVLVLDSRLEEVGLLTEHHRPNDAIGLDEKRMVLSQTARVATWHATSASPEEATARTRQTAASTVVKPVALISTPNDLAGAQQRLARFLRPFHASDAFYAGQPEITADSARQIMSSQLYLCRAFAKAASQSAVTSTFAGLFEERAEVLASLQPQISYLTDVSKERDPNMRRFWQQSELTTAVARMEDQHVPIQLQPTQMVELAKATHEVSHTLGKALRRELLRTNSNLRDSHPRHAQGPVRVGRGSRLEASLTDLVNMPAPKSPVALLTNPLQRAALRHTLDMTPTAPRPPSPFPAARSLGTSSYSQ